jgi:hypothetical protein
MDESVVVCWGYAVAISNNNFGRRYMNDGTIATNDMTGTSQNFQWNGMAWELAVGNNN